MGAMLPPPISQMIDDRMHLTGWSYKDLEEESDGVVSARIFRRLHQENGGAQSAMKPDIVRAIAQALDVAEVSVILAMAKSFGLDIETTPLLCYELPASTNKLTKNERAEIVGRIRELTRGR